MHSNYLTTVYGPVTPGLIKQLAQVTRSLGGEWLTSRFIRLDNRFAALMNVVVDTDRERELRETLERRFPQLTFVYAPASATPRRRTKSLNLVVECIDRVGLTGDLANILAGLDLGVEEMECKRYKMEEIGETVFSARLSLAVPVESDGVEIAGEIETLSEDVRVEIVETRAI